MPSAVDLSRDIGSRFMQALTSGSINDISYSQMNDIVRRLRDMIGQRTGVKVGQVLVEVLGVEKANEYVEKALSQGLITNREYEEMKATVLFQTPREKILPSWAGKGRRELLQTQKRIQREAAKLTEEGQQLIKTPLQALERDVERLRKSWGK